ncbi:hypothetical protein PYCC9005_000199 [Savitreella phatthalungensis]
MTGVGHVLCSPGSSGISLALARHFLRHTDLHLFATSRPKTSKDEVLERLLCSEGEQSEVSDSSRVTILELDFTEEGSVGQAAKDIKAKFGDKDYLRLVTITPGVLIKPEKAPAQIDYDDALQTFKINTLGPMLAMKHFADLLPPRKSELPHVEGLPDGLAVWATMSARVGSIGDNRLGGWYAYRASKAGVNQLTKTFDNHLQQQKRPCIAIALHPGTVKTHLSRDFWGTTPKEKLFTPQYSASKLAGVIQALTTESRGKLFDWKGEQVPP